jgi:hypothetical protein
MLPHEGAEAARIVDQGADELAAAAESVARRLDLRRCTVVLAGGIFRAVPVMRAAFMRHLQPRLPEATVRPLDVEPATGAVRLAIRFAQGTFDVPRYVDNP